MECCVCVDELKLPSSGFFPVMNDVVFCIKTRADNEWASLASTCDP